MIGQKCGLGVANADKYNSSFCWWRLNTEGHVEYSGKNAVDTERQLLEVCLDEQGEGLTDHMFSTTLFLFSPNLNRFVRSCKV